MFYPFQEVHKVEFLLKVLFPFSQSSLCVSMATQQLPSTPALLNQVHQLHSMKHLESQQEFPSLQKALQLSMHQENPDVLQQVFPRTLEIFARLLLSSFQAATFSKHLSQPLLSMLPSLLQQNHELLMQVL